MGRFKEVNDGWYSWVARKPFTVKELIIVFNEEHGTNFSRNPMKGGLFKVHDFIANKIRTENLNKYPFSFLCDFVVKMQKAEKLSKNQTIKKP